MFAYIDDKCTINYFKKKLDFWYSILKQPEIIVEENSSHDWANVYINDCKDAIEQLKRINSNEKRT